VGAAKIPRHPLRLILSLSKDGSGEGGAQAHGSPFETLRVPAHGSTDGPSGLLTMSLS
jgi:hypothetical protein